MPLIVCSACGRHNHGHGRVCAFCDAPLGSNPSAAGWLLGLALVAAPGCVGSSQPLYGATITKGTADTSETGDTGTPTTPGETADTGA